MNFLHNWDFQTVYSRFLDVSTRVVFQDSSLQWNKVEVLISGCDIGLFELLTVTIEQLKALLEPTETLWKYDELFGLIAAWRVRNVLFHMLILTHFNF